MSDRATDRLIVFARWPEAGSTKTRLIPALGPQGAADLQRQMTRHTLRTADRWARAHPGGSAEVRFTEGDAQRMAGMFGDGRSYQPQGEGDLGERMNRAINDALASGARRVVVIGTDCPGIDEQTLAMAFECIGVTEATIGPATDGGYYLIGMNEPHPELFCGIDWGTAHVRERTTQIAEQHGFRIALLPMLNDVDRPEDLAHWSEAYGRTVSVIIPARNEAARIGVTLDVARAHGDAELIVVDGGSSDDTATIAREHRAQVITSKPGRAIQMNGGAEVASGDVLIFCHADMHLPPGYEALACAALADDAAAGAFDLTIRGDEPALRRVERAVRRRTRWMRRPYGDQAIFLRRTMFETLDGYRDLPIMEDYDLIDRAKRLGKIVVADGSVSVSARYWKHHGIARATWLNQKVLWGWYLGVKPATLARWRKG